MQKSKRRQDMPEKVRTINGSFTKAFITWARKNSERNYWLKRGFRHAPFIPTLPSPVQPKIKKPEGTSLKCKLCRRAISSTALRVNIEHSSVLVHMGCYKRVRNRQYLAPGARGQLLSSGTSCSLRGRYQWINKRRSRTTSTSKPSFV